MMENKLVYQPIPDTPSYGVDVLNLSRRWTRADYLKEFGVQPPPFDPSRPLQRWWDSSAAEDEPETQKPYSSWVRGLDGKPVYKSFTLPARLARVPNLPGQYAYPKWNPAPLKARIRWIDATLPPPVPDYFCLEEEAQALQKKTGGMIRIGGVADDGTIGSLIYDPEEKRRPWEILLPNGTLWQNIGSMLRAASAFGVGAPGAWDISKPDFPSWVAEQQDTGEKVLQEIPIPQRQLIEGEEFSRNPFAGDLGVMILRMDRVAPQGGSGANLQEISKLLDEKFRLYIPEIVRAVMTKITGIPH